MFTVVARTNDMEIDISSFPGAAEVGFSLNGTTYQNNSIVMLENIGEGSDSLSCITDLRNCCRPADHVPRAFGNWFFPNLTRVPSSGSHWDYHRTRGQSVVRLQRRRGGEDGIYRCDIPGAAGVVQTLYIGVYSKDTGKPLNILAWLHVMHVSLMSRVDSIKVNCIVPKT